MDIKHEGKVLEEMNFEECFELEKVLLKRILQASTAQMHEGIINQLNFWLQQTQLRKQELMLREKMGLDKQVKDGTTVDTDEDEQEQPDDTK